MPTYEYICTSCGHRIDKFQGMNEDTLSTCPECSSAMKRLISGGTGFIMKGNSNLLKPSCGRDTTCCGSEYSCGNGCHE